MGHRPPVHRRGDRVRDDTGGVWIITGWVLGGLLYVGVLVAWHAGFTAAAPFVVIPAVLVFMVGAGNLLSGKRPGRRAPQFNRPDPIPLTSFRSVAGPLDGPHVPAPPTEASTPDAAAGPPSEPGGTAPGPGGTAPGPVGGDPGPAR